MIDRRKLVKWAANLACLASVSLISSPGNATKADKLLLVHGRGQQGLNPDALKAEWTAALGRGAATVGRNIPPTIDVVFPYYGDTLAGFIQQEGIPLSSDLQTRGPTQDDEFLAFQAEFVEAVRQRAGVTDAEVDREYKGSPQERGPLNWQWVQAILRAIDKHGGSISQDFLEAFTRDVFIYMTRAGVRDEIDRIVASVLTEQPTVVVGHSLGSVVAYSVLRNDPRLLQVPLFVTVGSPLGIRTVRDQFRPLRSPRAAAAWYNAFDTRDVVALYPLDAENFPIQPAIENNGRVQNSTENRHGITGYLDDPEVATHILDALKG